MSLWCITSQGVCMYRLYHRLGLTDQCAPPGKEFMKKSDIHVTQKYCKYHTHSHLAHVTLNWHVITTHMALGTWHTLNTSTHLAGVTWQMSHKINSTLINTQSTLNCWATSLISGTLKGVHFKTCLLYDISQW